MAIARAAVAEAPKGVDRRTIFATAAATGVAGAVAAGQAVTQVAAQLPAVLPVAPAAVPAVALTGAAAVAAGVTALAGQIVKVTVDVNKTALVNHLHAFLNDPTRANAPVVYELTKNASLGLPMPIVEHLLLEGDMSKQEVESFVDGMLGGRHDIVMH
jgi:hypothetical protein